MPAVGLSAHGARITHTFQKSRFCRTNRETFFTVFTALATVSAAGLACLGAAVAARAGAGLRPGFAGVLALARMRLTGVGSPLAFFVVTMEVPELQTKGGS